jgi:hypothetical protein
MEYSYRDEELEFRGTRFQNGYYNEYEECRGETGWNENPRHRDSGYDEYGYWEE